MPRLYSLPLWPNDHILQEPRITIIPSINSRWNVECSISSGPGAVNSWLQAACSSYSTHGRTTILDAISLSSSPLAAQRVHRGALLCCVYSFLLLDCSFPSLYVWFSGDFNWFQFLFKSVLKNSRILKIANLSIPSSYIIFRGLNISIRVHLLLFSQIF